MIRDKKELVRRVNNHLISNRIYILGIGDKAVKFASEHFEELDIAGFLTDVNTSKKTILINKKSIDIIQINEFELTSGEYIIIATEKYEYSDVFLSSHGCAAFNDYIWAEWYDIFVRNRKVILFEGNCQIVMIYYFLKAVTSVTDSYSLMVYHTHLYKSRYSMLRWNYYLVMCDYYISNNYMLNTPTSHKFDDLPVDCKVIKAPRIFLDILWPEVQKNGTSTYNDLIIKDKSYFSKQPHGPFDVGDNFVNELIRSGASDDEIIDELLHYKKIDNIDINEKMRTFFEELENQEKECDIVFSPYLKENIFKKKCFYDPIHMNTDMNWYVADQIVKLLGLPGISDSDIEDYDDFWMYLDHCTEIPIYPQVARLLRLEWVDEQTKYNVTFYDEARKMTFEEYYRAYINAARLSMNLMKSI